MSYERFRASITDPALIAVANHWSEARSGRLMPAWRDIDPASIKEHLPKIWAWRWDPALGTFIGRLAGEEITALLGKNNRGKRLDECFGVDAHDVLYARFKRVTDEPALMHSYGRVYAIDGRDGPGERIVLPLATDGKHGDGIIGATAYRLGARPTTSDRTAVDHQAVDHHEEFIDFVPLA
jgi:hypothetical protein